MTYADMWDALLFCAGGVGGARCGGRRGFERVAVMLRSWGGLRREHPIRPRPMGLTSGPASPVILAKKRPRAEVFGVTKLLCYRPKNGPKLPEMCNPGGRMVFFAGESGDFGPWKSAARPWLDWMLRRSRLDVLPLDYPPASPPA